jgi:hypothetical protein
VRQLGIHGISKSQAPRLAVTHDETVEAIRGRPLETARPHLALDALQVKVREAGCTVSVACGTDADRRYLREPRGAPDTFALSDPQAAKEVQMIAA